ncbi:hypothetical protein FQR65_LT14049 [Abscondita terminalis]|nr:hypothetical protein FQR65_LT14049 [Abscondita terminalis]
MDSGYIKGNSPNLPKVDILMVGRYFASDFVHCKVPVVDEQDNIVRSAQCFDCAASASGCKHAVAFLMWLHRRSEEPSCTQVSCYWQKSKLSQVGTKLKFILASELVKEKRNANVP